MRKITAILLAAPMALLSFSAYGQTANAEIEVTALKLHPSDQGIARPWRQIGTDPSQMNITEASAVLGQHTNIRPAERAEAWAMKQRGECIVRQMPDGDAVRTTNGRNRSMPALIAFGNNVPIDDPMRTAYVCIVRPDGTAVVFPNCANISDAIAIINRRPAPQPRAERPRSRGRAATMTMSPGAPQQAGTQYIGGVMLFDGGGHRTIVGNRSSSRSAAYTLSISTSGAFVKPAEDSTHHVDNVDHGGK